MMKPRGEESVSALDRWCEALDWYAVFQGADARDLTQAVGRSWQEWCTDQENRRAFDAVSRLMGLSTACRRRRGVKTFKRSDDRYDPSMSVAEWRQAEAERPKPSRLRHPRALWWLSGGVSVVALVLVLWGIEFQAGGGSVRPAIYETGPGGMKNVDLSDGSRLVLGQRTRLTVAYSAHQRLVTLIKGQAWFKIVHNPHWPFIVSVGAGMIRDVGTAFYVTRESSRVVVAVMDGEVEVAARPPDRRRVQSGRGLAVSNTAQVVLKGGEQLAINDNGVLESVTHSNAPISSGGAHGSLIFKDKSLSQVAAVLNLYSKQKILVDPAAGGLLVSGIVFRNEIPQWVQTLEYALPIRVRERDRYMHISLRRAKSPAPSAGNSRRPRPMSTEE